MCDVVRVDKHDVDCCADLAMHLSCMTGRPVSLVDLVQRGQPLDLKPNECLCNVDIEATAAKLGLKAQELDSFEDYADFEVTAQ